MALESVDDAVHGCHGRSEYRHVGEFVQESLADFAKDSGRTEPEAAIALCEYLAEAANDLAAAVRVEAGLPPEENKAK